MGLPRRSVLKQSHHDARLQNKPYRHNPTGRVYSTVAVSVVGLGCFDINDEVPDRQGEIQSQTTFLKRGFSTFNGYVHRKQIYVGVHDLTAEIK